MSHNLVKIAVCSNHELLADGYIQEREAYSDEINSAISDACRLIDDSGIAVSKCEGFFQDWQGGKYYRAEQVIAGQKYGYKIGGVCTIEADPSPEICALIDAASNMLYQKIAEIGRQEDKANEREITLNLYAFGVEKEWVTLPASEAKELLAKPMNPGWSWRIDPPDTTGEMPDDEARYAEDCKACGVENPFDN